MGVVRHFKTNKRMRTWQ